MIPSLFWPGVLIGAHAVGLEGFPENITDELIADDDFIQALHHLLLDIHIIEGSLICPETGYRFPIHEGIPSMMYTLSRFSPFLTPL
jgi:multifunctional methyltransferase subunit TRM112